MLKTNHRVFLLVSALAVMLSSCAHTKIVKTWQDPGYRGHPKKILVLAVAGSPTVRILFENQMVGQFEKHGLTAIASHGLLPDDLVIDKEALLALVRDQGVDTVFIARPVNRKEVQTLRPGVMTYAAGGMAYSDSSDDFPSAVMVAGSVYMPGTYAEEDVTVEMALFNVSTKKRFWSALADTYIWNTPQEEIKPAVERIIKKLVADKIIPQRADSATESGH